MVKFVRNQIIKGGITVGLILLAIEASRRFNLAGRVTEGARGLGEATGLAVSKPFAGIVGGVASGLEDLQAQIGRLGIDENFGCGVLRNCDNDPKIINGKNDTTREQKPQTSSILDLNKIFSTAAIRTRMAFVEQNKDRFSGVGANLTTQQRESALQKAIRESAEKFPQFFKVGA